MSDKEVQLAESHFKSASNKAEAATFLIKDVQDIVRSGNGDNNKILADLTKLNNAVDLKEKGFPADFSIVMGRDNDKLIVVDPNKAGGYLVLDGKGEQKFAGNKQDTEAHIIGVEKTGAATAPSNERASFAPGEVVRQSGGGRGPVEKEAGKDGIGSGPGEGKTITLAPGDTLWKLAKQDLPEGASAKEILTRVKEIAAANEIQDPNKIVAGDKITLPVRKTPGDAAGGGGGDDAGSGSKVEAEVPTVTVDEKGNKVTKWANGTEKHENADKSGYVKNADGDEHHWGPKAEDNFDVIGGEKKPLDYTADGGLVKKYGDITETTWADGTKRYETKDGSGRVERPDGSEHHWGPSARDNFDVRKEGGAEIRTYANGDKSTTWADGTTRDENADGTGSVTKPDGSSHHWGPGKWDNYDSTKSGGVEVNTWSNGDKETRWDDGTTRENNADGTGVVRRPDGSIHHWGPNPEDNWDITKDGTKITVGKDGETTAVAKDGTVTVTWKDGTSRTENADGTRGHVKNADGSSHHWGPNDDENFERTKDGGTTRTDKSGNSVTVWSDGAMRYNNADGSGSSWSPQADGGYKIHHWGKDAKENYDTTSAKTAVSA